MMNERILSLNEVDNVNRNLNMIESRLGYTLPVNLINTSELSSRILSLNEVDNVVRNIRMINTTSNRGVNLFSLLENGVYWLVGIAFVIYAVASLL